jgi:hypothetical protein
LLAAATEKWRIERKLRLTDWEEGREQRAIKLVQKLKEGGSVGN